jgi:steroid delta-isomerase-like uncharacterized protein
MLRKLVVAIAIVILNSAVYAQDTTVIKVDNKEWVNKFYTEFLNKGNIKLLDDLVADDYVENEPIPGFELNKKGLKDYFKMMFVAFPDFKANIDFMIVEKDKVVVYLTYTGTHKGNYMGAPASNKKINFKAVDIIKVQDGKMVEHWGVLDVMTMMEQLGMISFK